MSLKRPTGSGWVPCERGRLGVNPSPFLFHFFPLLTSTVPRCRDSAFTAARKCGSGGGASFLPVRCVLLMLMTGSPRGTASHAPALKPQGEAGEAVGSGCGGGECERLYPLGSYSLERDANVECRAAELRSGGLQGRGQPVFRSLPFKLSTCL